MDEENTAAGRVVTAPTNGAAGIVPAVLRYYRGDVRQDVHQIHEVAFGQLGEPGGR